MLDADDRVIMISGAARGIGLAVARQLHDQGFRLSLGARDTGALATAVAGWTERGPDVSLHGFDATDASTQRAWIEDCVAHHGGIDGLVNNAGVIQPFSLTNCADEGFDGLDAMWEVNVKTPARLTSLAYRYLAAAAHGRVVNIASLSGKRVRSGFEPGYAMTKHAMMALTNATRQAGWADGVRATAVCPSFVATEMISEVDTGTEPVIQPEDIAALVALALTLPDHASVAELAVNCRLEDTV